MIAAASNWDFVAAGYGLTVATLAAYLAWVKLRVRRLRRAFPDHDRD
jgi:hypothetical protein